MKKNFFNFRTLILFVALITINSVIDDLKQNAFAIPSCDIFND
jgi:hypothetical protein